jgi:uncharacterized protein (DUF362 family)
MFKIVRCETYDEKEVRKQLDELVDLSEFVNKGDRVLVKPNLLDAFPTERAVTTHPSLVKAVVEKIQEIGASVIIADSPQLRFNESHLRKVYVTTGMQKVAEETGCDLNYDTSTYNIPNKSGPFKEMKVLSVLKDVDKIINLCKVKCHAMAKLTCATKNLYGYVSGLSKMRCHMQMDIGKWANMLLDLEEYKRPVLTIADGVIGMEGQGPFGGEPKKLGIMVAGTNVYEMDYNICKIIGIEPLEVLYLKRALEKNKFEENGLDFSEYFVKFKPANIMPLISIFTKEYRQVKGVS